MADWQTRRYTHRLLTIRAITLQKLFERSFQKEKAMNAISNLKVTGVRKESDSLGEIDVPSAKLWGAQTQRSLEHFNIGKDLIPREMIAAYATLKKAAANANHSGGRLDTERHRLIVQT
jgi:fumarate hydratase class II